MRNLRRGLKTDFKGNIGMDIQTNVNMLMLADLKDWHFYETQNKIHELTALLEATETSEEQKEVDA